MSNDKEEKQYGLILSKKQQSVVRNVVNVFGDNEDSDGEDGTDWVKKALQAEGEKNKVKKQTKLNMQKALKEDPTIFQYDEVYDDMERTKEYLKSTKEEKKKPRYIQNLLKAAERRKKEQEYRIERMVQKEREAEGEMYADKESFVTSAYRAKLEEFKKMEEEENKMDRLEAIADVRKQQDMSGFYRHLYEQTIEASSQENDRRNNSCEDGTNVDNIEHINEDTNANVANTQQIKYKEIKKNRHYRQRIIHEDSDVDETEIQEKEKIKTKTVATEKHEDTESESEIVVLKAKKQKQQNEDNKGEETQYEIKTESVTSLKNIEEKSDNSALNEKVVEGRNRVKSRIEVEKKERSKIWEKRTVGPALEAALQRYYVRKAARLSTA